MTTQKWLVETIELCPHLTPRSGLSARREEIVLFGFAIALVLGTANLTVLQAQQPKPKESSQNAKVLINEKSVPASDTLTTSLALSRNESEKDPCDFSDYRPVRISHFDSRAILKKVHPEYPREAATRGIQGRVTIKALVNDKGNVEQACAVKGEELLRSPAEAAALEWKLKPEYGLAFRRPITQINPKNYAELYIVFDFELDKPGRDEPDQKTAALITTLQRGSVEEVSRAIYSLHALGKNAIPSLIESISSDRYVANLLRNPTSSYIQDDSTSQFAGVRSAYVIELILASDKLPNIKVKKTSFVLGPQRQDYLYSQAVIVKEAKQPISKQDLPTVRDVYKQWWEGNKGKSIEDFRKDWNSGRRPLSNSGFSWDLRENALGSLGAENVPAPLGTQIQRIEIDGKEIKTRYRVFAFSGKWIEAKRTRTGFILPQKLRSEARVTILITFGKHKLPFSNIHLSKFNETWIVGVDTKPFSAEFATAEEAKWIKRIYYIESKGSGLETQLVVRVR